MTRQENIEKLILAAIDRIDEARMIAENIPDDQMTVSDYEKAMDAFLEAKDWLKKPLNLYFDRLARKRQILESKTPLT